MIIVRRVKHRNQQASFSKTALVAGLVAAGSVGTSLALSNSQVKEKLKENPRIRQGVFTLLHPEAAIGIGAGKMFSRRRKTKNGKVIVEQVRRK